MRRRKWIGGGRDHRGATEHTFLADAEKARVWIREAMNMLAVVVCRATTK